MSTIVHLITGLESGGAERTLVRVVANDQQLGVRLHKVVCLMKIGFDTNATSALRKAGVEVISLGMRRGLPSPAALLRFTMLLRQQPPDLLMTWLYHADLLGTLAARLAQVKRVVWNIRCSNVDFTQYARSTGWTVKMLARLSHWPWGIGTNSHAGRRVHEALGYAPRRWLYLPNGVELDQWRPDDADRRAVRDELGLESHHIGLIMVARADPMKDHACLFVAVESLLLAKPNLRLILVGRGTELLPLTEPLAKITINLGERSDVPRLLRGMDFAVLSSAFGEGFPNAIAEAMSTGLPCVATDTGDSAELVGGTGIIVSPCDSRALAAAIGELTGETREATRRRALAARERIAEHWSLQQAASAYRDVWQQAID